MQEREEKKALVHKVFSSVASKYDIMNDVLSLGIHRYWKNEFITQMHPRPSQKLLDVGGGTGDIAFGYIKRGGGEVIICDSNQSMLSVGKERAARKHIHKPIQWVIASAEALPIEDNSIDIYATAFCIRNVQDREKALQEAYRVLKSGGHFLCLEFSPMESGGLEKVYYRYLNTILPTLGQWIAKDREAYVYLAESIKAFPSQAVFKRMIEKAGFIHVQVQPLSGGIVAIHGGYKP